MEFVRLSPNEYANPMGLHKDSSSSLELSAPHSLWSSNCAAASQLWPLEFVAARTRIFVVDTSIQGSGTIKNTIDLIETPAQVYASNPWWLTAPRGVTFLRIGTFLGREVLLATTDEGDLYMWRTLAIRQGDNQPWFHFNSGESTWGVDVHPHSPHIILSDNSGKITLLELNSSLNGLSIANKIQSEYLGGNIPSICFIGNFIAYTTLTGDLLAGSFGVLDMKSLGLMYSIKMQQAGWNIKPLVATSSHTFPFLKTQRAYDLCGSDSMPGELQVIECHDACHTSYVIDIEGDRLGLQTSWAEQQTWVKEQQTEIKTWIKHGRRKPLFSQIGALKENYFLLSTSTHGFLIDASTGQCLGCADKAFMPPGMLPSPEFSQLALNIVEVIEHLGIAILVSRAATVIFIRFTENYEFKAFRQELVLCDFPDFIVGLTCCPARAHDFEYDLRHLDLSQEHTWSQDVPDKTLGDVGTYLVRLHTKDGKVESFLLTG